ncbi:hypothetical protein HELRODRAFT_65557 [Helobdella robusta]|uniref:RUN domain-containing protein n=1 Tax=Helobdella robusta TaxID=6412 RepID=T1FY96_HELRO|nr:hypothetical protein HELRODRAFT_65557 [Helobdella robusta]ESO02721.1 hypothetical protein HELRODRAFT_65557 [Helobdella robusta]
MAKETIYLCNYRVSVDGDWLCLEELHDIELDVVEQEQNADDDGEGSLQRTNLLNVLKLIIKEILDSSLSHGRMLDDNNTALQQFFLVLEHILRHGLKPKKGLMREKRDLWEVLERIEKFCNEAKDITWSVRELPSVKTPLGRARAWLRLALMQKKLADYFKVLIDKKEEILGDLYEADSIMMEEEGMIIGGLLVGLNVIDCSLGVKDEDLDQPMGVIDFSLYLKENQSLSTRSNMEMSKQMAAILDQKNYLEELNRHLSATVANLQQKMISLQTATTLIKEDMIIAHNNILQLQQENSQLRSEKEALIEEHNKAIKVGDDDVEMLCAELKRQLHNECLLKQKLEKDLEHEMIVNKEMEMMMKIMEKDLKIRQSSLVIMKKENESLKHNNAQLQTQLQVCFLFFLLSLSLSTAIMIYLLLLIIMITMITVKLFLEFYNKFVCDGIYVPVGEENDDGWEWARY